MQLQGDSPTNYQTSTTISLFFLSILLKVGSHDDCKNYVRAIEGQNDLQNVSCMCNQHRLQWKRADLQI